MDTKQREKPTKLFMQYAARLVLRFALFVTGIVLLIVNPEQLDITKNLGLAHGFDFVDLVFILMIIDLLSKFRPHANIAMGSRKQYSYAHVPTPRLFAGGRKELRERAQELIEQAPALLDGVLNDTRTAVQETAQGVYEAGRQLAYTIDVLRVLPWPEEDLTADERMRESIRRHRMREIIPVIIFWIVFNTAIGLLLEKFGIFGEHTAMIWTLFYFLFDMICVVLWCPLQLALMRNRCCTTCQIFNWDGIMTVTPLLPIFCWFSWILIFFAVVVLLRWELAFIRHPERFDERTNASLQCVNCRDKLCYLRKPFTPRKRAKAEE